MDSEGDVGSMILYIVLAIVIIILIVIGARLFQQRKWGKCKATQNLKGKNFIVTGANCGIGLEVAKNLVFRGARVVFACRNVEAAKKEIGDIRRRWKKVPGEMIVTELDLASLESIRSFVEVVKVGFDKIDVLICNAGVAVPMKQDMETKDGFEINMGVNHLGHFLLTNLLLEHLKKAAPSRVVVVSSMLHGQGVVDVSDLDLSVTKQKIQDGVLHRNHDTAYANSKLMNIYFAKALAERTKDLGIDVFVLCPGFCYSNIYRYTMKWYQFLLGVPVFFFIMKTASQGAQTVLHCATEPSLQGSSGEYYENCKPMSLRTEYHKEKEAELWAASQAMVDAYMA